MTKMTRVATSGMIWYGQRMTNSMLKLENIVTIFLQITKLPLSFITTLHALIKTEIKRK